MKINYPYSGEVFLKAEFKTDIGRWIFPRDINWMCAHVSDEDLSKRMKWTAIILAIIMAPPSFGLSILFFWIAWKVSKKEIATIEIMTTDDVYFRGYTENKDEIKFAKRHEVPDLPAGDLHAGKKKKGAVLFPVS